MACRNKRQWLAVASLGLAAMGAPPRLDPAAGPPLPVVPVTFECGPGYHKPPHGQCVPDAGRPLLRVNRYPIADRGIAPRTRAPGLAPPVALPRPRAPWR